MTAFCAFLFEHDLHHLDHLAPFCALMHIPLYTTQITVADRAQEQYPHVDVHYLPYEEAIRHLIQNYNVIISCLPTPLLEPLFFFEEYLHRKKLLFFWIGHGYSDKDVLQGLQKERFLCVYGDNMLQRLQAHKITQTAFRTISVGNYRRHYYLQNKPFYQNSLLCQLTFPKKQKTVLFAPTWDNLDVFMELRSLLEHWDPKYNLMVKLHPNTVLKYPELLKTLQEQFTREPHIKFVHTISTIYPLLEATDVLITDHSSIAYDFLSFDRPLIFYEKGPKQPIHTCGPLIQDVQRLPELLKVKDTHAKARQALYASTFTPIDTFDPIKREIHKTIKDYLEQEPHLLNE